MYALIDWLICQACGVCVLAQGDSSKNSGVGCAAFPLVARSVAYTAIGESAPVHFL